MEMRDSPELVRWSPVGGAPLGRGLISAEPLCPNNGAVSAWPTSFRTLRPEPTSRGCQPDAHYSTAALYLNARITAPVAILRY